VQYVAVGEPPHTILIDDLRCVAMEAIEAIGRK
jgi:hypothetical protein